MGINKKILSFNRDTFTILKIKMRSSIVFV